MPIPIPIALTLTYRCMIRHPSSLLMRSAGQLALASLLLGGAYWLGGGTWFGTAPVPPVVWEPRTAEGVVLDSTPLLTRLSGRTPPTPGDVVTLTGNVFAEQEPPDVWSPQIVSPAARVPATVASHDPEVWTWPDHRLAEPPGQSLTAATAAPHGGRSAEASPRDEANLVVAPEVSLFVAGPENLSLEAGGVGEHRPGVEHRRGQVRPIVTALPPLGPIDNDVLTPPHPEPEQSLARPPGDRTIANEVQTKPSANLFPRDLGVRIDELPEWWLTRVADSQRPQALVRSLGLSDLIDQAIAQSPRIRMLQRVPSIAQTQVERERSAFDPTWRLDTRYRDDQEPVGNQLLTGGPPVLKDNTWTGTAGWQRRLSSGAVADVYQRLGFKNSNSLFFDPQDQGTATLGVDITQPLLFGGGTEFNRTAIILAELQSQLSFYDYQAELQREMVEIGTFYWQLLHARMLVLQIERSRQRAQQILEILQARASYDTTTNQISLAKAEVSQRTTEWLEAAQRVQEFEISLRDKIGDLDFAADYDVELLPSEFADDIFLHADLSLGEALGRAFSGRWELQREQGRTQIADRQLFLSRCGLAPRLDLVLGVYANGLAGRSGINRAWVNQFDTGTPGYYGGLEFELPQGRRNAKAEVQRDQLQKQQAHDAYQLARNEVIAQVKTAHSRVATAQQTRSAALDTVRDMREALLHLQRRWETTALIDGSATDGLSPSLALEQLLAGQRRLQDAEASLALADLQWALARQSLLLAMGDILKTEIPQPTTDHSAAD